MELSPLNYTQIYRMQHVCYELLVLLLLQMVLGLMFFGLLFQLQLALSII